MRRVRVVYGGREFTIPGVDAAEVQSRIEAALGGGDPWLRAVSGQGRGTDAQLLITAGTPIALLDETVEPDAGGGVAATVQSGDPDGLD